MTSFLPEAAGPDHSAAATSDPYEVALSTQPSPIPLVATWDPYGIPEETPQRPKRSLEVSSDPYGGHGKRHAKMPAQPKQCPMPLVATWDPYGSPEARSQRPDRSLEASREPYGSHGEMHAGMPAQPRPPERPTRTSWPLRLPRKPVPQKSARLPANVSSVLAPRPLARLWAGACRQKPAIAVSGPSSGSRSRPRAPTHPDERARRLVVGRSLPVLVSLMRCPLLSTNEATEAAVPKTLLPAQGLFATLSGSPVLIARTFFFRGAMRADVVPVMPTSAVAAPAGATCVLNRRGLRTCPQADLSHVGLHYQVLGFHGEAVYLRETPSVASVAAFEQARQAAVLLRTPCPATGGSTTLSLEPLAVLPSAAEAHTRMCPGHRTTPREHRPRPRFLYDVPLPRLLDLRPHRCAQRCGAPGTDAMRVTDGDVRRVCPGVLVHRRQLGDAKVKSLYLTRAYLLHLLQVLYEGCNLRGARRVLTSVCNGCILGMMQSGAAYHAEHWASIMLGVPTRQEIRSIALRAFPAFVRARVQLMRRRQLIYNFKVIRCDGNYDIACGPTLVFIACGPASSRMKVLQAAAALNEMQHPWRTALRRLAS